MALLSNKSNKRYLQSIQLRIAGTSSLVLATCDIELIAKGELQVSRTSLRYLQEFHLLVIEQVGIPTFIKQVVAFYFQGKGHPLGMTC